MWKPQLNFTKNTKYKLYCISDVNTEKIIH